MGKDLIPVLYSNILRHVELKKERRLAEYEMKKLEEQRLQRAEEEDRERIEFERMAEVERKRIQEEMAV